MTGNEPNRNNNSSNTNNGGENNKSANPEPILPGPSTERSHKPRADELWG